MYFATHTVTLTDATPGTIFFCFYIFCCIWYSRIVTNGKAIGFRTYREKERQQPAFFMRKYYVILDACFLFRPSTASTRSACTVLRLCQPTPSQRRLWEASTSVKPSRTFWRETYTPVISSCAHTPVLQTCPSHGRNSQVGCHRHYGFVLGYDIKLQHEPEISAGS